MSIARFLKKALIICFTKNPYRVKRFANLYIKPVGQAVDQPELLSTILKHENGEIEKYFNPVISLNQEINQRLIAHTKRFKVKGIFKSPDRYMYSLSNVCIIGQLGLVYDEAKRCFIDESAMEWGINLKNTPYLNALNLPPKAYLDGLTISYLTNGADGGFYHFLFESATKTGLYASILPHANQLLFNGPVTPWKLKWLQRAGIDTSKVIWVNNTGHYECEQLIFTNKVTADQQIGTWAINTLKSIFHVTDASPSLTRASNIIWISRKGFHKREIEWEDELLSLFPEIECIDLSQLSADETIAKMQQVTHVIGPHGAAFSNLYLCRPGTKVLEIYPEDAYFQPCYHRLSESCELNHMVAYLDFKNKDNPVTGINFLTNAIRNFIC